MRRRIDRLVMAVSAARAPKGTSRCGRLAGRLFGVLALLLLCSGTLEAQTVTLAWDANSESNLAGYIVYYGIAPGVYTTNIPVGNVTTYTVGGLVPGQPYYFALKAINTSGIESAFSSEVNSASPASAQLTTPSPGSTLTGSTVTFQWTAGISVPSYQLTVGTTLGGGQLFDQVVGSVLSTTVTGLPTNGSTVYVRLWSLIGTIWNFRDYTYTASTPAPSGLSVNNVSVTEGNSGTTTATFTVTLTPTSTQTVTVAFNTSAGTAGAPSDYLINTGTLTFAPGVSTQTIPVTVNGDTTVEPTETFFMNLSGATNATISDAQGTGTITNDDAAPTPTVTVTSPTTVTPGAPITAAVANGPANPTDWVTLSATTAPDTTYLQFKFLNNTTTAPATGVASATLTFTAPTTPGTYNLRFFANNTFTKLATSGTVTVAALPALTINNASVTEGNSGTTTATFTATLTPTSTQTVTVAYATANGTAAAGTDYVTKSGTLTFAAGVSTQPVTVTVNGDTTAEADETFVVNLSGATNATIGDAQGTGTITNDDAAPTPAVTVTSPTTVNPGDTITASVANGPANAMDWVTLAATSAADQSYLAFKFLNNTTTPPATGLAGGTLTFTAPTTPGTYNLRFFANNTFTKLATSATVTVQALPALTINNASVTEGNAGTATATFTATLTPTSTQTVTVAYATANGTAAAGSDYVTKSGTLTFAAGVSTQAVTVTVNGDTTPEADETFVVNLSGATNATIGDAQGTGTIANDDAAPTPTVTVSSTTVSPGGAITATIANGPGNVLDWVTLAATSAADPTYVTWQFLNGSTTPPAAGLTSATLQFTAPMAPGTYHIRFFENNTFTRLATSPTVTVAALPALTINNASVTEGNSGTTTATFTATLTPTSTQTVTVAYATANGTAAAGTDYVTKSGTLTFAAGVSTQAVTVTVNGDTTAEADETFVVNLSGATNATIADAQGTGTITNDDAAPTPAVTVTSPTTVNPGDTITASVANGPANAMDWVTLAATSAADQSYLAFKFLNNTTTPPATGVAGGTLTFTAPTTPGTYNLRFFANNTFTKLATSATVTVQGLAALTINNASVTEGNAGTTTATFTVTLTPTSTQTVTVAYATANGTAAAGSDYVTKSGTLTFAAGVSTQAVTVTVNGDTTPEADETFVVNLSGATNATIADAQGAGTIANDDAAPTPTVTVSSTTVSPGGAITATIANGPGNVLDWVTLAATSAADPTYVTWQFLNGSTTPPAAGLTSATLQFTAPMAPGTYHIRFFENNTFTRLATSPTVTVAALPALTMSNASVTEGNTGTTTATFTVTLTPTSTQTVTVAFNTSAGTAGAPSDYLINTGTLTFAPGVSTQTIPVTVNGDTTVEPAETFFMNLSGATNATIVDAQATGTIVNDDAAPTPTVTVTSPTTVNPGDTITATAANGPANPGDWVTLAATSAADPSYLAFKFLNNTTTPPATGVAGATLTFTAPTTPGTYNLRFFANNTFTKLATSATVTVVAPTTLAINNASVTEGDTGTATATFTVTLTPTSTQTVTVAYATANGTAAAGSDYVAKSGTLTFAAGVSTQAITVTVNGDTTAEADETFVVNLSGATNATIGDGQGAGTIANDDASPTPTVTVTSPTTVNPGDTITATVANGPANPGDWVTLAATSAADPSYLAFKFLNNTTTPPATGVAGATLTFTAPTTPGTYNLRFFANNTFTKLATSATVTVVAPTTLAINNASVTEGDTGTATATFTVTLTPTSTQTVTVAYATANGTAAAGSDYVAKSGTLTFAAGVSTQAITVTVNGDTTPEADETFVVNLSGATNATIADAQGAGSIANDDAAAGPTVTVASTTVNPGGVITATIANGPGNPMDWVTLAATSMLDSSYITWKFLNGSTIAPATGLTNATLQFTAPMAPGTYHIRFFENNTFTRLATSPTVTVLGATSALSINGASVTEGNSGTTTATFTVTLTPTSTQAVTVAYATADGTATAGSDYVAKSGTLTFAAGVATQAITVTVNGDTVIEADEMFVVNLSGATNATISDAQGAATITNDDGGAASPTVTVSSTTVLPGGTITATVANGPGNPQDWVTMASTTMPDSLYVSWKYLNDTTVVPSPAMTGGTVHFTAPMTPGTYNIRFFENNTFTKLATSATVTVQGSAAPTLTVSATTVQPGGTITVTLANGPGSVTDWVSLAPASAADTTYFSWKYLSGTTQLPQVGLTSATLQFTMPTTPGTYNFRFFASNTYTKLATSATVTVQ